jgi:hypothetical protein
VGEAKCEATHDNANHISWLNHLVLSLGKFLLVFCLTVSLCTSCYELVKKIIITWLWEMAMKYTSLYSKRKRELCHLGDSKSKLLVLFLSKIYYFLNHEVIRSYKFFEKDRNVSIIEMANVSIF